jgi:hypothetical protein
MTKATARAVVAALAVCGLGSTAAIAEPPNPAWVSARGVNQVECGVAMAHCRYHVGVAGGETDPAVRPLRRNYRHSGDQRWGRQGVEAFGQPDHPQRHWKRSFG